MLVPTIIDAAHEWKACKMQLHCTNMIMSAWFKYISKINLVKTDGHIFCTAHQKFPFFGLPLGI